MVSHLTNNETYFFREQPQLDVFADHVLRALKERKTKRASSRLRVLSAGCSTGEEALHARDDPASTAASSSGAGTCEVIGLDVDQAALEKARRAVYHHNSFRALAPGR